jgi:hypothetical protein
VVSGCWGRGTPQAARHGLRGGEQGPRVHDRVAERVPRPGHEARRPGLGPAVARANAPTCSWWTASTTSRASVAAPSRPGVGSSRSCVPPRSGCCGRAQQERLPKPCRHRMRTTGHSGATPGATASGDACALWPAATALLCWARTPFSPDGCRGGAGHSAVFQRPHTRHQSRSPPGQGTPGSAARQKAVDEGGTRSGHADLRVRFREAAGHAPTSGRPPCLRSEQAPLPGPVVRVHAAGLTGRRYRRSWRHGCGR